VRQLLIALDFSYSSFRLNVKCLPFIDSNSHLIIYGRTALTSNMTAKDFRIDIGGCISLVRFLFPVLIVRCPKLPLTREESDGHDRVLETFWPIPGGFLSGWHTRASLGLLELARCCVRGYFQEIVVLCSLTFSFAFPVVDVRWNVRFQVL
jgi:hypothetical protein